MSNLLAVKWAEGKIKECNKITHNIVTVGMVVLMVWMVSMSILIVFVSPLCRSLYGSVIAEILGTLWIVSGLLLLFVRFFDIIFENDCLIGDLEYKKNLFKNPSCNEKESLSVVEDILYLLSRLKYIPFQKEIQ